MESLLKKGHELIRQKDFVGASAVFRDVARAEPGSAAAYDGLAWSLVGLGELEGAKAAAAQATQLSSKLARPYLVRALIHHKNKESDRALEEAKTAYELDSSAAEIATTYGGLLLASRRPAESIDVLEMAVKGDPAYLVARQNLAVAYREIGDRARSWEQTRILFRLQPSVGRLLDLILATQQRHAIITAIVMVASLLSAWIVPSKILLAVPILLVVSNLYADTKFLVERRARNAAALRQVAFSLLTDVMIVILILLIVRRG